MAEKKKIGIIGAMAMEMKPLAAALEHRKTEEIFRIAFHQGELCGVPCVVAQSGVGQGKRSCLRPDNDLEICPIVGGEHRRSRRCGPGNPHRGSGGGQRLRAARYGYHGPGRKAGRDFRSGRPGLSFPVTSGPPPCWRKRQKRFYGHVHRGIVATGDLFVADPEKKQEIGRLFLRQSD